MLKLKEVLALIEEKKTFAIDPENKVVLTKQQLGEMIGINFEESIECLKDGSIERALKAVNGEPYYAFLDIVGKYDDPYVVIFHLQYELAPRLSFNYRDVTYRTIDQLGNAIYNRKANRKIIVEAMKKHLFSEYLALRNFEEKFSYMVEGVAFAEEYVTVDENIAYDLLSQHLSLRKWYKFKGRKFYSVPALYEFLSKKHLFNKFSKTMEQDTLFFAWLFYLGNYELVVKWKKRVDEIDSYIDNKRGEY